MDDVLDGVSDTTCDVGEIIPVTRCNLEVDANASARVLEGSEDELAHLPANALLEGQLELEVWLPGEWRSGDPQIHTFLDVVRISSGQGIGNAKSEQFLTQVLFEFDASLSASTLVHV